MDSVPSLASFTQLALSLNHSSPARTWRWRGRPRHSRSGQITGLSMDKHCEPWPALPWLVRVYPCTRSVDTTAETNVLLNFGDPGSSVCTSDVLFCCCWVDDVDDVFNLHSSLKVEPFRCPVKKKIVPALRRGTGQSRRPHGEGLASRRGPEASARTSS